MKTTKRSQLQYSGVIKTPLLHLLLSIIFLSSCQYRNNHGDITDAVTDAVIDHNYLASLDINERAKLLNETRNQVSVTQKKVQTKLASQRRSDWVVSKNNPELCLGLKKERLLIAELQLLGNQLNQTVISDKRNTALSILKEIDSEISNYEIVAKTELPNTKQGNLIAKFSARDQAVKHYFYEKKLMLKNHSKSITDYVHSVSELNECANVIASAKFYKSLIIKNGWPPISKYGKDFPSYIFYTLQHADHDLQLLRLTRDSIRRLFMRDPSEVNKYFYPDIADKIQINEGKTQLFGTFITCINGTFQPPNGIDSSKNVEERRKKLGLRSYQDRLSKFPSSC